MVGLSNDDVAVVPSSILENRYETYFAHVLAEIANDAYLARTHAVMHLFADVTSLDSR